MILDTGIVLLHPLMKPLLPTGVAMVFLSELCLPFEQTLLWRRNVAPTDEMVATLSVLDVCDVAAPVVHDASAHELGDASEMKAFKSMVPDVHTAVFDISCVAIKRNESTELFLQRWESVPLKDAQLRFLVALHETGVLFRAMGEV